MYKIRIFGRGGQGAKTAAKLIGMAAFYEGKDAQAFSLYGAERRGAPVTAFVRIDEKEIFERGYIHDPNCVIVLDDSLFQSEEELGLFEGLDPGEVLIINTKMSKKKIKAPKGVKVITVDATRIALEVMGRPIFNTAMIGAFIKATRMLEMKSVQKAIHHHLSKRYPEWIPRNINAIQRTYDEVKV